MVAVAKCQKFNSPYQSFCVLVYLHNLATSAHNDDLKTLAKMQV